MLKLKFLLLMVLINTSIFAQTIITGSVLGENKVPLIKVTVSLKEKQGSTTTNANGKFLIKSNNTKNVLTVSYIGYETITVTLQPYQKEISIMLKKVAEQLDDVVVIGYGTAKKKDFK